VDWTLLQDDEEVLNEAFRQIGVILGVIGKWEFDKKVLDINAGLGIMVQYMKDNGYHGFHGTEEDREALEYWDDEDDYIACSPRHLPFPSDSFDLVTWFSMYDGRVNEEQFASVIGEMKRVTKKRLIVKPYESFDSEKDKEFVSFMLSNRLQCNKLTPVLWYYEFIKE